MADKRINALTTTSASVGDDYFAIDGATNGTRALSAFSPTFGGNATVTGTLTVNGAGGSIGGQWKITNATIPDVWLQNTSGATSAYRNILIRQNSDDTFKFLSTSDAGVLSKDNILTGSNANGAIGIGVTPAAGASSLTVAGVIKTNDTTASTTTSSGALVVSGGVGVGGAINAGGALTTGSDGSSVAIYVPGDSAIRTKDGSSTKLYIDTKVTDGGDIIFRPRVSTALTLAAATGNATFASTTASTSTSSGALVVSGGVGVAGAGNFGGAVGVGGATVASRLHVYESTSGTGDSNGITIEQASTADAALQFLLTGVQRWTVGIDNSDSDKFKIGTGAIGAADRLTIDTTGNVVAGGSVQTSAPSGGTAAAWKLGTVATVSPTSPNRTIEVDIGGTIYYIHAKTTNN